MIELIEGKILCLRRIQRLLARNEELWDRSDPEQKYNLLKAIEIFDEEAIRLWILKHPFNSPFDKSFRELRREAKRIGILHWSRKNKWELAQEIQNERLQETRLQETDEKGTDDSRHLPLATQHEGTPGE